MTISIDELSSIFQALQDAWIEAKNEPSDSELIQTANSLQAVWEEKLSQYKTANPDDANRLFIDSINKSVSLVEQSLLVPEIQEDAGQFISFSD